MLETPKAVQCLLRDDLADVPMGNQQATEREQLTGMAMLFCGEGSLMLTRHFRKGLKRFAYRSLVQITNTDQEIVEYVIGFLKERLIPHFVHVDARRRRNAKGVLRKLCWQVIVSSLDGQRRFLEMVAPFMVGQKRREAPLVYEFIMSRIERNATEGGTNNRNATTGKYMPCGRAAYNEREVALFEKLRAMHSGASETTRIPRDARMYPKEREDIVRLQ